MDPNRQFTEAKTSPFLEFPHSLPKHMNEEFLKRRQRELSDQANKAVEETGTIPDELLSILQWYYKILELLLLRPAHKLPKRLQADIATEAPLAAFNALTSDYTGEVASVLELTLLPRAEYVCRLLLWSKSSGMPLRYPPNMYYPTLYGDFYWAHYFYSRRQPVNFFERMVKYNQDFQHVSPSAVLTVACLEGRKSFTASQTEMLSQEPSIAYQAALMFPRNLPLSDLLNDAAMKPQWAYHILTRLRSNREEMRLTLPADLVDRCNQCLQYSPPWMLEYILTTKLFDSEPVKAKELLSQSLLSEHPLCDDLRQGMIPLGSVSIPAAA